MKKRKILAEVVHLPESRVGNILMRPDLRDYEIPYLANSLKEQSFQLSLDDLMVSVKGNRHIVLRSKKLNKEIIPHLTNAHNYSSNSLPIYHFLCDLQTQNMRNGIGFSFSSFINNYTFIPRITYKDIVLQEATWNFKKEEVLNLLHEINNPKELDLLVSNLRKKYSIPDYAMLNDGDNRLLINFKNLTSVQMLLNTVKNRSGFKLTEFLFQHESIVKSNNGFHANQLVVSFYNTQKLENERIK